MRVRAKERAEFLVDVSGLENTRKILVGDANGRVSFAVFQQNIISRIVLLDKTIFQ